MPILPTDPNTGQSQPLVQSLGDLFSGTNRPQLNAFVANSQARNGLVSAQTQEAMIKASQAQEQQQAWDGLQDSAIAAGAKPSDAMLFRNIIVGAMGHDSEAAAKVVAQFKLMYGSPQEQIQGQQGFEGKVATPPSVSGNYLNVPGTPGT